ncbi:MAG: hypothetical protein ACE5I8_11795 [Thermodesulfobacteriota bacterium]
MRARTLGIMVITFLAFLGLMGEQVSAITLSSSQWGAPEGKGCIECHQALCPSLVARYV